MSPGFHDWFVLLVVKGKPRPKRKHTGAKTGTELKLTCLWKRPLHADGKLYVAIWYLCLFPKDVYDITDIVSNLMFNFFLWMFYVIILFIYLYISSCFKRLNKSHCSDHHSWTNSLLLSGCFHRKCLPWWPFVLSVVSMGNLGRADACPSWRVQMALWGQYSVLIFRWQRD